MAYVLARPFSPPSVSKLQPLPGPDLSVRARYRYEPLDHKHHEAIRLIRIKSGLRDGLIDCELWHASLKSSYSTLSYVCGSPDDPKPILVNGKVLNVYENLWQFLNNARQRFTDRSLWTDAIYIAQHEPEEKSQQVQMMSKIYSSSQEVLVWLGSDTSEASYALGVIGDFPSMSDEERYRTHTTDARFRQGFRDIFGAAYWQRTWIVQEYILPQAGLLIQRETSISLAMFDEAVGTFRGLWKYSKAPKRDYHGNLEQFHYDRKSFETCEEIVVLRNGLTVVSNKQQGQFRDALGLRFEKKKCKDIRDRVFAMLAFTTHGHTLTVNYELSPLELVFESIWLEHKVAKDVDDFDGQHLQDTLTETATALNLSPAGVMMYAKPAQRSFKRPGDSHILNLPDDAEALHLRSADSGIQSLEEFLLAPDIGEDHMVPPKLSHSLENRHELIRSSSESC